MIGEALGPETAPVIGRNLVERADDVIEGIGFDLGHSTLPAMKEVAKIVDGFLVVSLLADDGVDPQPVENVFAVIIEFAPPGGPLVGSTLHGGNAIGRILQIAPSAAGNMIKVSGVQGEGIA